MKKLLFQDKKALSEVVGVVLLIIIAVGVAVLVYNNLEIFVPKEKPECPDGVSLVVKIAECQLTPTATPGKYNVNLLLRIENQGRFKVDGAYIRLGPTTKKVKETLNKNNAYFEIAGGLMPEGYILREYKFSESSIVVPGENVIEIEPFVGAPGKVALCDYAIVTYPVTCKT